MKKKLSVTIDEHVVADIDSVIDNVFIRNRSQAIEHLVKGSLGANKIAVVLSGGSEEKFRIGKNYRITAPVGNSSVVELAVKKLRESGFKEIFIVARHNILTSVFDILKDGSDYNVKVNYIEEKESNGSADSLKLLTGKINTDFLVVYNDVVFNKINLNELWNQHLKRNSIATLMLTTSARPAEKGTVKMEGNKILEFVQKPRHSDIYLVFSPIFAAEPELFECEGNSLEYDVFPKLAARGLLQGHLSSEKEIHIHNKDDVLKVKR